MKEKETEKKLKNPFTMEGRKFFQQSKRRDRDVKSE